MTEKLMLMPSTPYLSVVYGRRPEQKVHVKLAHAEMAFDTSKLNKLVTHPNYKYGQYTHGWGEIYEHVDGEWKLLYTIPQPTQDDLIVIDKGTWTKYDWETRPWKKEQT